jgi:hypothetical protein
MISMPSFAPSASKSHDKGAKREQNPPYSHYNGLKPIAIGHDESKMADLRNIEQVHLLTMPSPS